MSHNITFYNINNINAPVIPHQSFPTRCQRLDYPMRLFRDSYIGYDFDCSFEHNLPHHREFNCLNEETAKGVVNAVKHLDRPNYHLQHIVHNLCCITTAGWQELLAICNNTVSRIKGSINQQIERCKNITMALSNRTILSKSEIQRCEEKAKSSMDYNNHSVSSKADQIADQINYRLDNHFFLTEIGKGRFLEGVLGDTLYCFHAKQVLKEELEICEKKAVLLNLIDQEYQRTNTDAENNVFTKQQYKK